MPRLAGTLLLPEGAVAGAIEFEDRISRVELGAHPAPVGQRSQPSTGGAPYLAPGFVDVHVHGGGGGDTMDGPGGVLKLAAFHLTHGTTTILPTTMTSPWPQVLLALDGVRQVRQEARGESEVASGCGGARTAPHRRAGAGSGAPLLPDIPGAHLEGPFISPQRLGAQPPFTQLPTPELVAEVLAKGVVRLVTMAPEVEHAFPSARAFVAAGARVSVGHTVAGYDVVAELLAAVGAAGGTLGFTHLYNAMSQLGSREPGVVGAALASREAYAELILDLHHVHGASFLAAHAAKPGRLLLITDAIRASGGGETASELGGQAVTVRGGAARLADGTLAGSVLTLDQAVRNAVGLGLELHEAVKLASTVPAAYLGLDDRGSLAVGRRGDLVVLDEDLQVTDVFVAGRRLT